LFDCQENLIAVSAVTGKEAFKEIAISAEIKEERSAKCRHRVTGVTSKLTATRPSRKEHGYKEIWQQMSAPRL
jgi:hypothetical protein